MLLLKLLPLVAVFAAGICNWCVFGRMDLTNDVLGIARLKPQAALKAIRERSVCVKVMRTKRKVPPHTFAWEQIEKPTLEMKEVTQLAGLMGKTLCAGEIPVVGKCQTIILASDAPFSTLIHEYLHVLQIARDPGWCPFSKAMWHRGASDVDLKLMSDKEWDVHLFLWNNYKRMNLEIDDQIAIVSETVNLAQQRKNFDPDAKNFLAQENAVETLNGLIAQYKKRMEIKK
ncbi:MAG: hypothetical protein HY074_12150 [Deltaproteobacteria bacterium]|nr:hypothetical protein [Deltaproteobacteria bacterium]